MITEGRVAIGALLLFSFWLFVGLPLYLGQPEHIQYHATPMAPQVDLDQDPHGTARSPYFVQLVPELKSSEQRTQEVEERQEKRKSEVWLVRWTAMLFAATIGLFLATAVMGFFAYQQMKDLGKSIDIAKRSADAAHIAATTAVISHLPVFQFRLEAVIGDDGITPRAVRLFITNIGFRALLRSTTLAWVVAPNLPVPRSWPETTKTRSFARTPLNTDETLSGAQPNGFEIKLSSDDSAAMQSKSTSLWVFGGFCFRPFYNPLSEPRADDACGNAGLHEYRIAQRFDIDEGLFVHDDSIPTPYVEPA